MVHFVNGDIKQNYPDGKTVYYFNDSQATQTTFNDGLQVFKFNNGQIEKHYPDGSKQIAFPDGSMRYILADGYEETYYQDGSIQKIDTNGVVSTEGIDGVKKIKYPDGKEEIITPNDEGQKNGVYNNLDLDYNNDIDIKNDNIIGKNEDNNKLGEIDENFSKDMILKNIKDNNYKMEE